MYKHMVNTAGKTLWLLLPEWQGYGVSNEPAAGARTLAARLFTDREVQSVEAPDKEMLATTDRVLGLESIAARMRAALNVLRQRAPDRIVTVGATCGVELAPVSYLNQKYAGGLAVLWLDAHGDLNTPATSPSGHFHGMVLRTLLGDGPEALVAGIDRPLVPAQVWLVGSRDLDPPETAYVNAAPIRLVEREAFKDPVEFARGIRRAGFERVYLHLDLDVIDPADFGSSLMRTPGGPSLDDVEALICQVTEQCEVVGFSVVEFCDRKEGDAARLAGAIGRFL
jgi:arginase